VVQGEISLLSVKKRLDTFCSHFK